MTREEENYEMMDQFFNPQIQAIEDLESFLGADDSEIPMNWTETLQTTDGKYYNCKLFYGI